MSQVLTLYTTPVIYLYMDRLRLWGLRVFKRGAAGETTPGTQPEVAV